MTCLEKKIINDNILYELYESPYHNSSKKQRQEWIYNEKNFFDNKLYSLWKLYSTPLSKEDISNLSKYDEIEERRRFIKKPITIGIEYNKNDYYIFGGGWIDSTKKEKNKLSALIHFKVSRNYRKYASNLFNYFINRSCNKYDILKIIWGKRNPEDNPQKFLERHGFIISKEKFNYNYATKIMK
jgi:hypothetical protein